MATLALAAVGAAVGSTLLPSGITLLGATLTGAAIGSQIGAFAGSYVDQVLLGGLSGSPTAKGRRLSDLHVTASTEGAPVPRIYGRVRVGGQVIWADEIEEVKQTQSAGGGGKGLGGGVKQTTFSYYASFAVALGEGEITGIGQVWADGRELDLSNFTYRVYEGSNAQLPDDIISARLGADTAPAFRGVAYIVFERMPLAEFGNRLPQLSFEVTRDVDDFASDVRGVVLIPGSGEFVYASEPVMRGLGFGSSQSENVHTRSGVSDWTVSLDQMQELLPSVQSASLVVSWFGSDLRAGSCLVRPGVDTAAKVTTPIGWSVAGVSRESAYLVSQRLGRPAYGGTPSDQTVVAALKDLRARGIAVTLTPFILMDIPVGNALPNPYDGTSSQPTYPWRGRITCDPAPGQPGSADKTVAAGTQVQQFVGSAAVSDFAVAGEAVTYGGPNEWSFRRLVLHYAHLAKAAGGVDAFVIGTELRGLTQLRSAAQTFPFVSALVALAADVKAVLGSETKVTYAADWSEYFGYHPTDGSGDVFFHLDPLWSSPGIDAIGIDLYWPLADWRDGPSHVDRQAGAQSTYELDYLASNVAGGEGYDWYYATSSDRVAQQRTPITDGAGKPWVFRYKDIKSWWTQQHYNRPGGVEVAVPTAWMPQSKPFWLMEIGCPAVDKGANQPNVFVDPKSSENALPYFSRGVRDDFMQRQYVKALTRAFDPNSEHYAIDANPMSSAYGGRMVALDRIHVYAWDARPYPAFPNDVDVWGDGENWALGHWLNGRVANAPLGKLVQQMMADYGFAAFDADRLNGMVPGYRIDQVMSARDALQPLCLAHFVDVVESGGKIAFRHRGSEGSVLDLDFNDLVELRADAPLATLTRGQETELPDSTKITYIGTGGAYRQAVAESRRLAGLSGRVSQAELPLVLDSEQASAIADTWLHETWIARERLRLTLPSSRLAVEPGDVLSLQVGESLRDYRVTEVAEAGTREIEARAIDTSVYDAVAGVTRPALRRGDVLAGTQLVHFLDLPVLRSNEPPEASYVVAYQRPWPGDVAVYRSPESTGFTLQALIQTPATIGVLETALPPGPSSRLDRATRVRVTLAGFALFSVSHLQMLGGANAAAVRTETGAWEVLQFERAELVAAGVYELSNLLRGQAGTEHTMSATVPAGAPFVLLDLALTRVPTTLADIGLDYTWRHGPASRDIGDSTYQSVAYTPRGVGLRPYAPVHVRGHRTASGDLHLSWVRRTRIGGDSWEVAEVPLGEASEAYEVEIADGASVVRVLTATSPNVVYSAGDQVADFGAPVSSCSVRVYQMSTVVGRGAASTAVV